MKLTVDPYTGQSQTSHINVPASIAYKGPAYSPEEGPWVMLPYASLYPPPPPPPPTTAWVPPPIHKTDIWSAMQTFPL